ncbi:MAG: hypothetical protein ACRC10_12285 [Thermoguttaceae bacterium]
MMVSDGVFDSFVPKGSSTICRAIVRTLCLGNFLMSFFRQPFEMGLVNRYNAENVDSLIENRSMFLPF